MGNSSFQLAGQNPLHLWNSPVLPPSKMGLFFIHIRHTFCKALLRSFRHIFDSKLCNNHHQKSAQVHIFSGNKSLYSMQAYRTKILRLSLPFTLIDWVYVHRLDALSMKCVRQEVEMVISVKFHALNRMVNSPTNCPIFGPIS